MLAHPAGSLLSACRKSKQAPFACFQPIFICLALPEVDRKTCSISGVEPLRVAWVDYACSVTGGQNKTSIACTFAPAFSANITVRSLLPPSTTMTSTGKSGRIPQALHARKQIRANTTLYKISTVTCLMTASAMLCSSFCSQAAFVMLDSTVTSQQKTARHQGRDNDRDLQASGCLSQMRS